MFVKLPNESVFVQLIRVSVCKTWEIETVKLTKESLIFFIKNKINTNDILFDILKSNLKFQRLVHNLMTSSEQDVCYKPARTDIKHYRYRW